MLLVGRRESLGVADCPEHGGHVAFMSTNSRDEDRFWAENRVVEFCKLIPKVI